MAAISFRSSILGFKVESTKGTPAKPAGVTDFLRVQDDFQMSPEFENLENAELVGTIGIAKPIRGQQNPTAGGSSYLKNSGAEATAPRFAPILKSLFGAQSDSAAEYDTVASSTVALLKVDTGEGATFERGEFALIKDGTNGYRIRPIQSISGDDLTLGFQLPSAPASGVNLGRCTLFKPADADHQTLTLWHYAGNGGAVQMEAGAHCTEMSCEAQAGQLLNANFAFEALSYLFNPIEIASADRYLDFEDDDGDHAAVVTAGWYGPVELALAIQTAMRAVQTSKVASVVYNSTGASAGKFTISCTGTTFELKWNTGGNTANTIGDKIGFSTAADDTSATTYTSDNVQSWAAAYTPTFDTSNPLAVKHHEVMVGDSDDYACFGASQISVAITNTRTPLQSVCAESGREDAIITQREIKVNLTARLTQHEAEFFDRYKNGTETRFQYSFGEKVGGNWVAGKCGAFYGPTMTVSSFNISQEDGVVTLEMELTAYVENGLGEFYLGFV